MITRRSLFKSLAVGSVAAAVPVATLIAQAEEHFEKLALKGDIRQSVSRWCFQSIPLDALCTICKNFGMVGIDLINENEWDTVNKHDLIVTMSNGPDQIGHGFNRIEHHDGLVERFERLIPIAAEKKVPNIICFSGNRRGVRDGQEWEISDEQGLENCTIGIKRLMPIAEKHGITIYMELLNSLRDHHHYQADKTPWGAELVGRVGSERFKLLYDIYHMQIMEGNMIDNIRRYKDTIGHYHTAGVPGRRDLDDQQEIYYPAVIRAIKETGYKGFVAHEFIPKDGIQSLREAVKICDV